MSKKRKLALEKLRSLPVFPDSLLAATSLPKERKMTTNLKLYKGILKAALQCEDDPEVYDGLLDILDTLWLRLTEEELTILDQES